MRLALQALLLLPLANGFLIPDFSPGRKPGLDKLIESQKDQRLSVDLDIGKEGEAARLAIKGVLLNLKKEEAKYEHIAMPGHNGPNPKLSTGIKTLEILKEGNFINQMGTQVVKTMKGCWELVWKKDAPAGSMLCGFEIPEDYSRNEAKLPKGRIYLSFPVWTKETLSYARSEKERILKMADEYLQEKDEELHKYQTEPNLLKKALHYRNAYAAAERYWLQPVKQMKMVPDEDEVLAIQDDLLLTTKGLVWSKTLPIGKQTLLGTATISPAFVTDE